MEKPWGICSSNQIVGILNRPEPPPEPLIFSRSRGPNAQFGPSATPLFKILKKEWRPRQAAPDPPPQAALLSRILEGGACSGVVAPCLGGRWGGGEKGGRRGESSHQGGSINSNGGNIPTIFTMKLVIVLNNISAPSCLLLICVYSFLAFFAFLMFSGQIVDIHALITPS